MEHDFEMNETLFAIFEACRRCIDIVADDVAWLAKLPAGQRQDAVENNVGRLASFGFIRRGPGHVAVTIGGLMYIHDLQRKVRVAA